MNLNAIFVAKALVNLPLKDRDWIIKNISPESIGEAMAFSASAPEPQKFFNEVVRILRARAKT